MFSHHRSLTVLSVAAALLLIAADRSDAQVTRSFSNPNPIAIPASGPATSYQTPIIVSAPAESRVIGVRVILHHVTHPDLRQVSLLVRGPHGQYTVLSHYGSGVDPYDPPVAANDVTLTFSDTAPTIAYSLWPGTAFKPKNSNAVAESLPSPAPAAPYPDSMAIFDETSPSGVWSLFVNGVNATGNGTIAGGWTVEIDTAENLTKIAIPQFGIATPYPSAIDVEGLQGTITHARVTLYGVTHTAPVDIKVLLVSPLYQAVLLMANAGGGSPINGVTLGFDPDAASQLPASAPAPGIYQPTHLCCGSVIASPPAPNGPYVTDMHVLNGLAPNGIWRLYVWDDSPVDAGSIDGWSLDLTTAGAVGNTTGVTVFEGLSSKIGVFRVGGTGGTVQVTLAPGSLANVDYTLSTTTVQFNPGEFLKTVIINGVDDALHEGPESDSLLTKNPTGGAVLLAQHTYTSIGILDNDLFAITGSPTAGSTSGGTIVSLWAGPLPAIPKVLFGGVEAQVLKIESGNAYFAQLAVVTPPHAAGPVDVLVQTAADSYTIVKGFTYMTPPTDTSIDTDGDGMPDWWELRFGLDPTVKDGKVDMDGDGVSNLEEYKRGTHPRGFFKRYLAEGATGGFFSMSLATLNTEVVPANILYEFQFADGSTKSQFVQLNGLTRATLDPSTIVGGAEFSTVVESDREIVVDRTMAWPVGNPYGSHLETASGGPSTTWYLAEGATSSSFDLFYLLQNPNNTSVTATVQYDLPAPQAPIVKTYTLGAHSRTTLHVNEEAPALAWNDVGAEITANAPIMVERSMYRSGNGRVWDAGHAGAAVTSPASDWFFAEGATGSFFDLFLLLMNPNSADASVSVKYLLTNGQVVTKQYVVAAHTRRTVYVDAEGPPLADAAMSMLVHSDTPIVAERAMWWPDQIWYEASAAAGATQSGTRWAIAEGESGGTANTQTYILIANTSTFDGHARVTLLFEDGTQAVKSFPLNATSRFNVDVAAEFPEAHNRRYGAIVESLDEGSGHPLIVVERAEYADGDGQVWGMGGSSLAMRLQ
jgi:hypothetical protein